MTGSSLGQEVLQWLLSYRSRCPLDQMSAFFLWPLPLFPLLRTFYLSPVTWLDTLPDAPGISNSASWGSHGSVKVLCR